MAENYGVRIPSDKKENLEALALLNGCTHGDKPSVRSLIIAIADGEIGLIKNKNVDKSFNISDTLNHQNNIDSFKERLTLAIAHGLAANMYATDYQPETFAEVVRDRVDAILCFQLKTSVYTDYPDDED